MAPLAGFGALAQGPQAPDAAQAQPAPRPAAEPTTDARLRVQPGQSESHSAGTDSATHIHDSASTVLGSAPVNPHDNHAASAPAQGHTDAHGAGKFDIKELLFHHVLDAHDWHITDIPSGKNADGSTHYVPVALHLPYILYNTQSGLEAFMLHGHTRAEKLASAQAHGYSLNEHDHLVALNGGKVIDLSITKTVLQMLMVGLALTLVFAAVARSARRNAGRAPRGLQSFFEPVIVFVRDEIAKPNLQGKHERYLPYLLTLFFFIWFSNLFGLTPLNSNIAGNISVTAALAVVTFFVVQFSGTRDYWQHIFWFPGVPVPVKLLMLPVEFLGLFTKPFSLTIRLFANIAGGHFMVLSLVGLIFLLGSTMGPVAGYGVSVLSVGFTLVILALETIVAIVQAYVFTLLSAVFIGQALEHHHHHADHAHHADDDRALGMVEGTHHGAHAHSHSSNGNGHAAAGARIAQPQPAAAH